MDERRRLEAIAADRERIERPVPTPHLQFRSIGEGKVLLLSESFNTLLHGKIYDDLLPLLDGRREQSSIIDELSAAYPSSDVQSALSGLAAKGYIVSGDFQMEQGKAAFWSSLGAAPRRAAEKLNAAAVAVHGDIDRRLALHLEAVGIRVDRDKVDLCIYVCDDFLGNSCEKINRRHLDSGVSWLLVRPMGISPLFGPVFRPQREGPCWACLSNRMSNHQEVHSFVRHSCGESAAFIPNATDPAMMDTFLGIVAVEIAKWFVFDEQSTIDNHLISFDAAAIATEYHPVMKRPQCSECGDESLRNPNRPAQAVHLKSSPKHAHTSGGVRSVSPRETIDRYRHLISPLSGIASWIERTTPQSDPWLHVHWAGSNLALKIKTLSSLRLSLRSKSAGKGSTADQSEASALCEAIERYSGTFHGDEIRRKGRLTDFLAHGDEQAIHPNDVQLFSDRQLARADEINARGLPYNIVPKRFDPDREIDWTPVWSLSQKRHRYLPTSLLYGMSFERDTDKSILFADTNGCAAGNTLEEAILQGFFELVERDAFAIWWYNRIVRSEVDLASFDDDYLDKAADYYHRCGRDIWVLDITCDIGIYSFVALSRRIDNWTAEDIIYGAGAHIDPHIAVQRAVCELNQCLSWVPRPGSSDNYVVDDPMSLWWWKNTKLADHAYLAPAAEGKICRSDYTVPDTEDVRDDIEWCRLAVESKGLELLVLDQTRADVGLPVARVIVPGLRHFWERLAPGRLFDVPVESGWCSQPATETELNPMPVIA